MDNGTSSKISNFNYFCGKFNNQASVHRLDKYYRSILHFIQAKTYHAVILNFRYNLLTKNVTFFPLFSLVESTGKVVKVMPEKVASYIVKSTVARDGSLQQVKSSS